MIDESLKHDISQMERMDDERIEDRNGKSNAMDRRTSSASSARASIAACRASILLLSASTSCGLATAMLTHMPEREITDIYAMNDGRRGGAENIRRIVEANFASFGNSLAIEKMSDGALEHSHEGRRSITT